VLIPDKNKSVSDHILNLAAAFMGSKYLYVASELGLFECLSEKPKTLEELGKEMQLPPRTLRVLADAMVALGLLTCNGDYYQNDPAVTIHLGSEPESGLRPFLRFWNHIAYPRWIKLDQAVKTGRPVFGGLNFSKEEQQIFSDGVESLTRASAHALASAYDFNKHKRILDLGGGTGSFLILLLNQFAQLRGTLFETTNVVPLARARLENSPIWPRIEIIEGDFFKESIPEGHDLILIANVMHSFSPEQNIRLLRFVRQRVESNARLLLIDFWTDPTRTKPLFSTLIAGEFLLYTGVGDVYSVDQVNDWLRQTSWRPLEDRTLIYPQTMIAAEAG